MKKRCFSLVNYILYFASCQIKFLLNFLIINRNKTKCLQKYRHIQYFMVYYRCIRNYARKMRIILKKLVIPTIRGTEKSGDSHHIRGTEKSGDSHHIRGTEKRN